LFQQVHLFLVVRIDASFKVLELGSVLLRVFRARRRASPSVTARVSARVAAPRPPPRLPSISPRRTSRVRASSRVRVSSRARVAARLVKNARAFFDRTRHSKKKSQEYSIASPSLIYGDARPPRAEFVDERFGRRRVAALTGASRAAHRAVSRRLAPW